MNIEQNFLTQSDCYLAGKTIRPQGIMVHSLGVAQPDAQVVMGNWNRSGVNACVHAFVEENTVYQTLPWDHRGWHAGTGTRGQSANNTHISFECCEPAGHTYAGGTMVGYDVEKNQFYFQCVYENAAQLCARLCTLYHLDPTEDGVIICHSEGYARGVASNHADVMHWWPKHGKNMDTFRARVKALLEEDKTITQEEFNIMMERYLAQRGQLQADDWSRDARKWAEAQGLIQGDAQGEKRYKSFCTREELAVLLERMGSKH